MKKVFSFYDVTGEAVKPWARAGYKCVCFDIQNNNTLETFPSGGEIKRVFADLHNPDFWIEIMTYENKNKVEMVFGFPVCTDLSTAGARWWASKRAINPRFQDEATTHARQIAEFAEYVGAPYIVENPVGALSKLWRKPNFYFHPYEFGGYIPKGEEKHPEFPEYIENSDRYFKRTGIWSNASFTKPMTRSVTPIPRDKNGMSKQFAKLGGKSEKTKNIRSATPRGFALAIFENHHH